MTFAPQSILVPVDVDDAVDARFGDDAVDRACDLATQWGSTVRLLAVVPIPILPSAYDTTFDLAGAMQGIQKARVEHAKSVLGKMQERAKARGVGCEVDVVDDIDAVPRAIVSFAKKHEIDLITIHSHGRRGLTRLVLGSVAERVAHLAPCPVMLWRPEDAKK